MSVNKLFFLVTTCEDNLDYFVLAMKSLLDNVYCDGVLIMVVDFGPEPSDKIKNLVPRPHSYVHRSNKGFCNNINFGIAMSLWMGYTYLGHANDDVIVRPDFFEKGTELLESSPKVGFVSGVQQVTNSVTIPIDVFGTMQIPPCHNQVMEMDDLKGVWGDFSAWIAKTEAIRDIRYMDETFDPVGILADNDWLLRLKRAGWKCLRNFNQRYLHAKGITQRKHRPGFPNDEVTKKARAYFIGKWGVDAWSNAKEALFREPFNKEC